MRLTETGPVRIERLRVLCREATTERAVVVLRAILDSDAARTVSLRTTVGGLDHEQVQPLALGDERGRVDAHRRPAGAVVAARARRADPARPHVAVHLDDDRRRRALGPPVAAHRPPPGAAAQLDRVRQRRAAVPEGRQPGPHPHGARRGHPGASWRTTSRLAVDAGLDLLRVHAHITRPELYDAADEQGLLLWQDLPLQWGYARSVRKQAVRQAAAAVDLLGHHPSIAIWCGHNEPMAIENDPGDVGRPEGPPTHGRAGARRAAAARPGTRRCSTGRSSGPSSTPTAPAR